jgi:maltose/moltooligosaccharide transporter
MQTESKQRHVRPSVGFWQIFNMCFGFLGLQFGFALQNANVSRIFQTLGASVDAIPMLWVAAPLTGLIVQPIVGYFSDRTWSRLGRRRPYFLIGAILASAALIVMPQVPALWMAAGLLWILDASINISMEPFRAFVGDQLPTTQRASGYSMQSFFIGVGSVIASMMPWLLARYGISNHGIDMQGIAIVPDTVRYSFWIGAVVLLLAILWTVITSREYPPETLHAFADSVDAENSTSVSETRSMSSSWLSMLLGGGLLALIYFLHLDPQLYLVAAGILIWGIASQVHSLRSRLAQPSGFFDSIMNDLQAMPFTMRRLVPVQFFSWLALFSMWIYTTSAVAQVHFGSSDPASDAYNQGANWVGVLFAAYNGFAAVAAIVIPLMAKRLGLRMTHLVNVWLGAAGLLSFHLIHDPDWLLLSMVGVGFAWASILSLPYTLLSDSVPAKKMGTYMGIFNFFIVIPQLLAASVLGVLLKLLFNNQPIHALTLGAISFIIAGAMVLRVPEPST